MYNKLNLLPPIVDWLVNVLFILLISISNIHAEETPPIDNLNIEDLLNVKVTSVSKKEQPLNDAAAAIFVISNDDIKRSGATSLPEALRLAPGLDVARIAANKWAVTSRGFNGLFANKLQVLIDGRTLYNRAFAGVAWENQDVDLEDIDRIEVIRGPGATMWGSNAVNGVINIITKSSTETQGGNLTAGAGNFERGFGSLRYGKKFSENTTARAYIKGFDRSSESVIPDLIDYNLTNVSKTNNSNKQQGGFRVDSILNNNDELTIQGDLYLSKANLSGALPDINSMTNIAQNLSYNSMGGNLLSRFQRTLSANSDLKIQMYYDTYNRDEAFLKDSRQTVDFDAQHRFLWIKNHEITWGANYKIGWDNLLSTKVLPGLSFNPTGVNDHLASTFFQDEISWFNKRLSLNFGSKLEHNSYSGFEAQPSAHIMWAPEHNQRIWAGVSRAVRTPSRIEQDASAAQRILPVNDSQNSLRIPVLQNLVGNKNFHSEDIMTYEIGYRTSIKKVASLDITGFYTQYKNLIGLLPSYEMGPGYLLANWKAVNLVQSQSNGIEVSIAWQMLDWWRWEAHHSWLQNKSTNSPAFITTASAVSPNQRSSVRSLTNLTKDVDFDIWFRYTDKSVSNTVYGFINSPSFVAIDLRTAWRPIKNIELSITGQNLLQTQHLEYVAENYFLPTAVVRGVYGQINLKF